MPNTHDAPEFGTNKKLVVNAAASGQMRLGVRLLRPDARCGSGWPERRCRVRPAGVTTRTFEAAA